MPTLTIGHMSDERAKPVQARLSDDAHEGLMSFCAEEGITLAAFLEALGLFLGDPTDPMDLDPELIRQARQITFDRRTRTHQ